MVLHRPVELARLLDFITTSAPSDPGRLGVIHDQGSGERSRNEDYRLRFSSGLSADRDVGLGDRRDAGEGAESREKGGGAGLLCGTGRVRTSGHRSQWAVAVVRAGAGGVGTRGVDWGCGEDTRQLRAEAEDRPARRGAAAEASGGGSFSADLV